MSAKEPHSTPPSETRKYSISNFALNDLLVLLLLRMDKDIGVVDARAFKKLHSIGRRNGAGIGLKYATVGLVLNPPTAF